MNESVSAPDHTHPQDSSPYQQADLSVDKRVDDLLSRMTLEEKAAQMTCMWNEKDDTLIDADGNFDLEKARDAFADGLGLGQVGRPSDSGAPQPEPEKGKSPRGLAELTNDIQRFFIENSRLGIPVIFHEECLHGLAAVHATSFPSPLPSAPRSTRSWWNGSTP